MYIPPLPPSIPLLNIIRVIRKTVAEYNIGLTFFNLPAFLTSYGRGHDLNHEHNTSTKQYDYVQKGVA
jgi:hypothetical protein